MALTHDVVYAFRSARLHPWFTAAVTATLALCIGANTAIFSVIDATLLRPLPYPDPERLMMVATVVRANGVDSIRDSQDGRTWEAVRDNARQIDAAVYAGTSGVNMSLGDTASFVQQQRVSAGFFRVFGVAPMLGREFTFDEDRVGGPPVAVLSYRLWQSALGGDPGAVGKTLMLRGEPYTITGVMPAGFQNDSRVDVWTPLRPSKSGEGSGTNYSIAARIKPQSTFGQANGELESLGIGVLAERRWSTGVTARMALIPLQQGQTLSLRTPLLMLWGAVGLVLLIGCVNIASMLLARGTARAKEIATRLALGGGRGVIIRQMLVENMVLSLLGGITGIAVGWLFLYTLQQLGGDTFGFLKRVSLDLRVLAATGITALLTSVVFGLYPAWQASRVDIRSSYAGGRGVARHRGVRSLAVLVAGQVALAVPLLIGAGLLVRTLGYLTNLPAGFDPSNVIAGALSLQDSRYQKAEAVNRLFNQTLSRLREVPGIEAAAVGLSLPYERPLNTGFWMPGAPKDRPDITNLTYVSPNFFGALRIPLRRGRLLQDADSSTSAKVIVVNEAFAKRYFAKQDPLGVVLNFGDKTGTMIVGVMGDVPHRPGFGGSYGPIDAIPGVYMPVAQVDDATVKLVHTWFSPSYVVRSSRPALEVQRAVEAATRSVDPLLPIAQFRTLDEVKARTLGWQRLMAWLLGVLAGLAALLAVVGVYSMIANSVVERTRELGIRMAIGATVGQAIVSAARPGVLLAVIGVALGCGLAQFGSKLVQRLIWGIRPNDSVTYAAVIVSVLLLALAASLIPSLRIVRMNPARTLREE